MQASRSVSFLNHLIVIQQSQRAATYNFSKNLKHLRECASALENLYSRCSVSNNRSGIECSISSNQYAVFQCLWKQKVCFHHLSYVHLACPSCMGLTSLINISANF